MGLCCLCYNFLLWEEMEGARVGLLRGGAGSRVAGECTGKGFIGHRCTDPSNAPFHCPSPAGHHHLFFWGLYHGRCQTGPRLSGLTGLGNSGHWFVGSPCHWPLFLGLGVGPETQTSWVLRVEKTRGPCLSVKDTGWNEDAPLQAKGPSDSLREGEGRTSGSLGWAFTSQPSSRVTSFPVCEMGLPPGALG